MEYKLGDTVKITKKPEYDANLDYFAEFVRATINGELPKYAQDDYEYITLDTPELVDLYNNQKIAG